MELEYTEEEKMLRDSYAIKIKLRVPSIQPVQHTAAPTEPPPAASPPAPAEPAGPKRAKVIKVVSATAQAETVHIDCDKKYDIYNGEWDSRSAPNDEPLVLKLENVDPTIMEPSATSQQGDISEKKDTLVVWATMPQDASRFSFNIARPADYKESDPNTVFLYHFSVRDGSNLNRPSTIIQSSFINKAWSADIDRTIKGFPIEKGKQFQLRLTFCPQGIVVFLDGKLLSEFPNRYGQIQPKSDLYLVVPTREEEFGEAEKVIVHRVWLGHTLPQVPIPGTAGRKRLAFTSVGAPPSQSTSGTGAAEPPKIERAFEDGPAELALCVTGLSTDGKAEEELASIFGHYQVDTVNGRRCLWADNAKGQGFVKLENTRSVQTAIAYLNNIRNPTGTGTLTVMNARKRQVPTWFEC